jgi:hypothetical protein
VDPLGLGLVISGGLECRRHGKHNYIRLAATRQEAVSTD